MGTTRLRQQSRVLSEGRRCVAHDEPIRGCPICFSAADRWVVQEVIVQRWWYRRFPKYPGRTGRDYATPEERALLGVVRRLRRASYWDHKLADHLSHARKAA